MEISYAIIVSVLALLFSVYQFVRATHKENDTQMSAVLMKLEIISEGITEIKADMKNVKKDVQDLRERVAKVEASAASAHKRLDTAIGGREHDR